MSEIQESVFACSCTEENAPKFLEWVRNRGGIAKWRSINMSNPGQSWSAPVNDENGVKKEKPSWQCANEPEIFTDPEKIGVYTEALYKAFPVGIRRGSQGLCMKLTDGAMRTLDKWMQKCRDEHGDAFYKRGVLDIDGASMGVFYTTGEISLAEWAAKKEGK